MKTSTNAIRCEDCGMTSISLPNWSHDDAEMFCGGCGESLGTIRHLRELLEAALRDETDHYSDNDN